MTLAFLEGWCEIQGDEREREKKGKKKKYPT